MLSKTLTGALGAGIFALGAATSAQAATITVNDTGNRGGGTLRSAIVAANNTAAKDTIKFDFAGTSVRTITPTTPLPVISQPVKINGYTYRTSVASMGGRFMLGISAEVRERADVAAGDQVDINLELDTDPRDVTVPPDLQQALATDAHARTVFEGLSYSRKQRHVLSIEGAKTDETRQRRIGKAIAELSEGKG